MVSSLRACFCACQAGCPRTDFKLSALPQVSGAISRSMSGQDVALIVVTVLVLVAAVVLTAIWAGSDRRKAAFDVLDRLLPWRT
jgi:hypothetical protein